MSFLIRQRMSHSRQTVRTEYEPENQEIEQKTMNPPKSAREEGAFAELPAEPTLSASIDRRTFLIRNAVIGAAAVMTGAAWTPEARAQQAAKEAAARLEGGQVRLCQELSDVHSDRDAWRSEVERLILIEHRRNERECLPWWKRLAGWAPNHPKTHLSASTTS